MTIYAKRKCWNGEREKEGVGTASLKSTFQLRSKGDKGVEETRGTGEKVS